MARVILRLLALGAPLFAAAYAAGCSSDDAAAPSAEDAGADVAPAPVDAAAPFDAADAADAGPDCAHDLGPDGLPNRLSCTGLYSDFASKTVATDNKAYTPAVEFWSDGAVKSRWLYLPPGATIDITNFDAWKFPDGTRVWKEFIVDGKRIETRLYQKLPTMGFQHTTYRWNADDSEAVREDLGEKVERDGGSPYEVPTKYDCTMCHQGGSDSLLGVEAINLGMPAAKGVTLATLAADGRFSAAPPTTAVTLPDGQNGTAAPALGWLHSNCGACHYDGGYPMSALRLRITWAQLSSGSATVDSLPTWTTAVNKSSGTSDGAGGHIPLIAGGAPHSSEVSIRSGDRVPDNLDPEDGDQMPPLVSRRVDTAGHQLLDNWITQISP